jgi:hypothetical protein
VLFGRAEQFGVDDAGENFRTGDDARDRGD